MTTLRVYSAWVPEADSRAANTLGTRLPVPPALGDAPAASVPAAEPPEDTSPYRRIAGDLLGAIGCGALREGDQIPTLAALAEKYDVAVGTAHRAVALLASSGYVTLQSGRRTVVAKQPK